MSPRLSLVLCLGAVLVAAPPAAAESEPGLPGLIYPPPPRGIVLPDCRPTLKLLLETQTSMKAQLDAMQQSLAVIETALIDCPADWLKTDHSCFKLNGEELTAEAAAAACQRWSPRARLACLHEDELEVVHGLVDASPFQQAWIGLRRVSDGWQWSDGSLLEEGGPWLPYQPDNNGGEDCVMYDRTARYSGWTKGWSDERCVLTAPSVCEISLKH